MTQTKLRQEQIEAPREFLEANRTYYVRTDGSDSNDGLTDSSGGAFLTIQHAVDVVVKTLDFAGYTVTIQVGNGTYTAGVLINTAWVGGPLVIQGDTTTPSNVVVSVTSGNCFRITALGLPSTLTIAGFKLTTTTSGHAIIFDGAGQLFLGNMNYGSTVNNHISAVGGGAYITVYSNYTISGGCSVHWLCNLGGSISCASKTITLTGTPAFTIFAYSTRVSRHEVHGNTFSGSATGKRYTVDNNSAIYTNGAGATYLPGDVAGTTATGGQYI